MPDPTVTQCYNRYMFVEGNPISFIDMDGYQQNTSGISKIAREASQTYGYTIYHGVTAKKRDGNSMVIWDDNPVSSPTFSSKDEAESDRQNVITKKASECDSEKWDDEDNCTLTKRRPGGGTSDILLLTKVTVSQSDSSSDDESQTDSTKSDREKEEKSETSTSDNKTEDTSSNDEDK